jgi:hypothetical protein
VPPVVFPPTPTTEAHRKAMYRRIFRGIPRSFLVPEAPENQAVIGAIAYGVAFAEQTISKIEAGLFLDTANGDDADENGVTSIQRWASWLQMEQLPNETAEQLRQRIMARLFSPRLTIDAIEAAIHAASGLVVRVEEPHEQILFMNDGPWAGRKLAGRRYGYMAIDVVTEGQQNGSLGGTTNVLPGLMPFLRAAGCHWRHIEVVSASIALLLDGKQASAAIARQFVSLWPSGFRPNYPVNPGAYPLRRPYLFMGATYTARAARTNWGGGAYLVAGPPGAPVDLSLATYVPPGLPTFNWDDSLTLWDESAWAD